MDYIEYINNLRNAMKIISNLIPEIIELAEIKSLKEKDKELEMIIMPDMAWDILQEKYLEVEDKVYQFNPEKEYGIVHTMDEYEMRGDN